ncbi:kinase [Lysinibacillus sp. Bpr_S20]|uniref:kinase n=1 Tax=Lysinibacillus sp. Bpr_S20 TaxID=2933964 RepID=UPI0020119DD9|nr:kinase [Lysinibacillus sp. Bpr_S20]MCL1702958.1 kinase [Lysinibacillus sp. Bpr_S20]
MDIHELKSDIIKQFKVRSSTERPFIVAIDGLGGAGKSTVANKLAEELQSICAVALIHIDNHIVERSKRYDTGYDEWYEYYYLQWDIEFIKNNMLLPLHNNKLQLLLPFYNQSADTLSDRIIKLDSNSILLIEGIFLLRHEWRNFYDYRLFIDLPRKNREDRVLRRDAYIGNYEARLSKYKRRYWPTEDYYLEKENPLACADIVIF